MKVYSKLDSIPKGKASNKITEGCLVLEGGAFRGLYSQGFLDAMMLNDLNLSCVIGVSAGALGGMNYVSGQIGRSARINLGYRHDSRYVGSKALIHSHSILDVGFLTEDRNIIEEKFDFERFNNPSQRYIAVATSLSNGKAIAFEKGKCSDIILAIKASATMPYISPAVMIDNEPYLDGGCACKIPYKWAIDQGYKKIIVIRTREKDYRKPNKKDNKAHKLYGKYLEFTKSLENSNIDYNHQCDEIETLHNEGRLLRFAPSKKVTVSRIEKDLEKLGELYWLGYNDCLDNLDKIKEYLNI